MLSAISADEYKQNKQLTGFLCSIYEVLSYRVREPVKINKLDSASRTFWGREFENWCKKFSESLRKRIKERYKYVIKHQQLF